MTMHAMPTHGLRRSPILAAFQSSPLNPSRDDSALGQLSLMYVHVQMVSNTTERNDLKSNRADMLIVLWNGWD